jgi:hypothetical protein
MLSNDLDAAADLIIISTPSAAAWCSLYWLPPLPGTANNRNSKNKNVPGSGGSQYNEHQAAADGVEIIIRSAAASRSLDNITSLILGLKGLKKTI